MDEKEEHHNVVSIFDEPGVKKAGSQITVQCTECDSTLATVLYVAQQPFYEGTDTPTDVAYYLIVRCQGKRCETIGIVEQRGRQDFERVFPTPGVIA